MTPFLRLKCPFSICPLKIWCFAIKFLLYENLFFLISPRKQCNCTPGFLFHLQNSSWFQI
jgi:hypothetical protein